MPLVIRPRDCLSNHLGPIFLLKPEIFEPRGPAMAMRSPPIKRFKQPPPAPKPPHKPAPSNKIAAHAVRVASSPGKINPKQQVY